MSKRGTCWVGYEQKGMKKKGGKLVPNCVPAGMKKGGLKEWFRQNCKKRQRIHSQNS